MASVATDARRTRRDGAIEKQVP
eukprot:COSAG01_NODE_56414_length_318_cov_1.424658_1_plen_22_part_01